MNKILVFSPHPDDETLGCGGTILKYRKKGWKVDIIFFTKMSDDIFSKKEILKRNKEILKVCKLYDFNKIYNLGYTTTRMNEITDHELILKIKKILINSRPKTIFFPSEIDIHTDHNKISKCLLSNVKSFRHNFIENVYAYETLSETNFNFKIAFTPNHFENISNEIKKKIKIMKIYKSELKNHPFPRSTESIISLAKLRGSQANFLYAESFETYFSKSK